MGVRKKPFFRFKPLTEFGTSLLPVVCWMQRDTGGVCCESVHPLSSSPVPVADVQVCSGPHPEIPNDERLVHVEADPPFHERRGCMVATRKCAFLRSPPYPLQASCFWKEAHLHLLLHRAVQQQLRSTTGEAAGEKS